MGGSGAKSLAFLARQACMKYSKRINDVGDCPYDLVRTVLLKLDNPEQLRQIEINSPQIIGHDSEVWLQIIKRDIPDWEDKLEPPDDPEEWWEVYKELKEQVRRGRELGALKLKAALDMSKDEREQNVAKLVAREDLPREPTNYRARSLWNHAGGQTRSSSKPNPSFLSKLKKERRDTRSARMQSPKATLPVLQAPPSLVEELKRQAKQQRTPAAAAGMSKDATTSMTASAQKPPRSPVAVTRPEDEIVSFREMRQREMKRISAAREERRRPPPRAQPGTTNISEVKMKSPKDGPRSAPIVSQKPSSSPSPASRPPKQQSQIQQTDGVDDGTTTADESSSITTPIRPPRSKTSAAIIDNSAGHPPSSETTLTTSPHSRSRPLPHPRPRFGSPGPGSDPQLSPKPKPKLKRKPEPSLFMKPKKSKPNP